MKSQYFAFPSCKKSSEFVGIKGNMNNLRCSRCGHLTSQTAIKKSLSKEISQDIKQDILKRFQQIEITSLTIVSILTECLSCRKLLQIDFSFVDHFYLSFLFHAV